MRTTTHAALIGLILCTAASSEWVFQVGPSTTGKWMPRVLAKVAEDAGIYQTPHYETIIGAPIPFLWEHSGTGDGWPAREMLVEYPYDALILNGGYGYKHIHEDGALRSEFYKSISYFKDCALTGNPGCQVFLQTYWPDLEEREDEYDLTEYTFREVIDMRRIRWHHLIDTAEGFFDSEFPRQGDKPIRLSPTDYVLLRALEAHLSGDLPDIILEEELIDPSGHLHPLGEYAVAMTHFSVIYKRSPVGLFGHSSEILNRKDAVIAAGHHYDTTALLTIQKIAWNESFKAPRSGLSDTPAIATWYDTIHITVDGGSATSLDNQQGIVYNGEGLAPGLSRSGTPSWLSIESSEWLGVSVFTHTVSAGGLAPGMHYAKIEVSADGVDPVSYIVALRVEAPEAATGVTIELDGTLGIIDDTHIQLRAVALNQSGDAISGEPAVTWSARGEGDVTPDGLVTMHSAGPAVCTVSVAMGDTSVEAELYVSGRPNRWLSDTPFDTAFYHTYFGPPRADYAASLGIDKYDPIVVGGVTYDKGWGFHVSDPTWIEWELGDHGAERFICDVGFDAQAGSSPGCKVMFGVWDRSRLLGITPYLAAGEVYTFDLDISNSDYLQFSSYLDEFITDKPSAIADFAGARLSGVRLTVLGEAQEPAVAVVPPRAQALSSPARAHAVVYTLDGRMVRQIVGRLHDRLPAGAYVVRQTADRTSKTVVRMAR